MQAPRNRMTAEHRKMKLDEFDVKIHMECITLNQTASEEMFKCLLMGSSTHYYFCILFLDILL